MDQYKARINVRAQGHIAVTLVRLETAASGSRVKRSTTETLRSLFKCLMGSDLECYFSVPIFVHKHHLPAFVSFFLPVSVLASMHACEVWFEPSILGLGKV